MPLLQTTTGFETFPQASAKVYVFHLPTRQFPGKEQNLNILARAGGGVSMVGAANRVPCAAGANREMGEWSSQTYEIPEGMLLKVFANRNAGFGQMRIMASLIIRIRAEAALRRLSAILTQNPRATITRANIEGRFDIVPLSEAMMLGATVPPSFQAGFEESMTRRAFEMTQLAPETSAPVALQSRRIETSSGETVEVTDARRRRALDL